MKIYQVKHNNLFYKVLADSQQSATAQDKKTIFVSYSKNDNEAYYQQTGINIRDRVVEKILKAGDCAVWVDESKPESDDGEYVGGGLVGGENWDEVIRRALNSCSMMVLLVTPSIFNPEGYIARVEVPTVRNRRDSKNDPLPIYPIIVDSSLAHNFRETWSRVSKLTGSKEQGDILLSFDGSSPNEKKFDLAIKNILGMIPDEGVAGKIRSVEELIRNKDFRKAKIANDELRILAPERYESYWFECQIITKRFTIIEEDKIYSSAEKQYLLAKNHISANDSEYIISEWNKYVDRRQRYVKTLADINNCKRQLDILIQERDEVKEKIKDNTETLIDKWRGFILISELITWPYLILAIIGDKNFPDEDIPVFLHNIMIYIDDVLSRVNNMLFWIIIGFLTILGTINMFYVAFVYTGKFERFTNDNSKNSSDDGTGCITYGLFFGLSPILIIVDMIVNVKKLMSKGKRLKIYNNMNLHLKALENEIVKITDKIKNLQNQLTVI